MNQMKMLFPLKVMGLKLYIQSFLTNLIFGYLFRRNKEINKCGVCGKSLGDRRIELSITRPSLDYNFEFDEFLCINHAIQTLLAYRSRFKGDNLNE